MSDVEKFCRRYNAWVSPSQKRHTKVPVINSNFAKYDSNTYTDFNTSDFYRVEPCVEVTLPERSFRALVENRTWLDEFEDRNRGMYQVRLAQKLVEDWEEECDLRNKHPNLQDAWGKYQLLLNLIK